MDYKDKLALCKSYVTLINESDWDYYITFTTQYTLRSSTCRTLMRKYFELIQPYGAKMFWAKERFDKKEGYHIPGVLKLNKELMLTNGIEAKYFQDLWYKLAGVNTTAYFAPFEKGRKTGEYLTKDFFEKDYEYDLF